MIRGILLVLVAILLPVAVMAQETAPATAPETTPEAAPATAPATPEGLLAQGHQAYLSSDYEGALKKYEQAREADSGSALPYYFIGCAQAKLQKIDDAVTTLNTAATIAGSKDLALHAKALFQVAVILETSGSRDQAKDAWTKYLGFAQTHKEAVTFEEVAKARLEAIENYAKLDADYAVVRERSKGTPQGEK